MALLDEILKWTQTSLTPWQRDAARRLFQKKDLVDADYDELYALLRESHGLPGIPGLVAVPLAAEHLPAAPGSEVSVSLTAMRSMKNVNRLASSQALKFSSTGISIIYGGNGAGKSGYSRVLKKACRARDQSENVLPDATNAANQLAIPEATFDLSVNGVAKSVTWRRGVSPPEQLSSVAVFDSRCARVYLTAEQAVAYLPYGLDVVESLANKVLPLLATRLAAEIESVSTDVQPFAHLLGDTAVGKLVGALGVKTNPATVNALADLKDAEVARLTELEKTLSESDPKTKAAEVRLQVQRLDGVKKGIDAAVAWVLDPAIEKLRNLADTASVALAAERAAAEAFRAGENLLEGTGDVVWKALFEAARRFSMEAAYPARTYPHVHEGALCVLCQQPLEEGAARLERFEAFVKQDAATVADEKRKLVAAAIAKISGAQISLLITDALNNELAGFHTELPMFLKDFGEAIEARRQAMLKAVTSRDWTQIPPFTADPREPLNEIIVKLGAQAAELDKAGDEAMRKALEKERGELRARQSLIPSVPSILALIDRFQLKAKLESCKQSLKTKGISDKSKELSSNAVTKALQVALDEEFSLMGMGHIKTKLTERTDKGKMKYKLLLDLPVASNLEEILSEGEQRAIAIGSFLAELKIAGHNGAVVFDDPVSSLDHWRRLRVARRLAKEAENRQVIVFTHDTAFLGELRDCIDQMGVTHSIQNLEWRDDQPGHVSDGLPWEHQGYKERLDALEKAQKAFEKLPWPAYPGEADASRMRGQYSQMRSTIERIVQDIVFCGVVRRYRDWIRMDALEGVVGFQSAEQAEISRLHKRCCDITDAHDPSSAKNSPVPTAIELGKDIDDLKAVVAAILSRRKKGGP